MRILCVHQGFELYGSDRCFLDSVRVIRASFPHAHVAAVIPRPGPITAPLSSLVDHVTFGKIWVLRKHGLWKSLLHGPISLPVAVARAVTAFRSADLVYINTVTVLDYLLAAAFFSQQSAPAHSRSSGGIGGGWIRCPRAQPQGCNDFQFGSDALRLSSVTKSTVVRPLQWRRRAGRRRSLPLRRLAAIAHLDDRANQSREGAGSPS